MDILAWGHWSATGAGDFGCKYIKKRRRRCCATSCSCRCDVSKGLYADLGRLRNIHISGWRRTAFAAPKDTK
jgi:hypothetical protein